MDNLFLSRDLNSIEIGPQLFAGTLTPNTTFYFNSYPQITDPPGLFNSVLIQNAGRTILNGIYSFITDFDNKPYYVKDFNPDWFIIWFGGRWEIYDYSFDFIPIYFSAEDVLYPWNVTNWSVSNIIDNPPPTVTKVL